MQLLHLVSYAFLTVAVANAGSPPVVMPRQSGISCSTYTVQANDTCIGISNSAGATWAQILSWNSAIDKTCSYVQPPSTCNLLADNLYFSNLDTLVDKNICVSNPLGDFSMPTNTIGPIATATTAA